MNVRCFILVMCCGIVMLLISVLLNASFPIIFTQAAPRRMSWTERNPTKASEESVIYIVKIFTITDRHQNNIRIFERLESKARRGEPCRRTGAIIRIPRLFVTGAVTESPTSAAAARVLQLAASGPGSRFEVHFSELVHENKTREISDDVVVNFIFIDENRN